MSFQGRAWRAAADEYGKARAEKYGRIARIGRTIAWTIGAVLVFAAWLASQGRLGS